MANRYWVGGTGNWSDTAHWSATSGGTGGASLPTSNDDVFFDMNSFSAEGQTVTIDAISNCKNMDWVGVLDNPTLAGSSPITIYGSLQLKQAMFLTYNGNMTFSSSSADNTIITEGLMFLGHVIFNNSSGTWTFLDFFRGFAITVNAGTLNTNDIFINLTNNFSFSGSSARTINMGNSELTIGGSLNGTDTTGLSFNSGSSVINIAGATFNGGGLTYNNVNFTGTLTTITGSNTFNSFILATGTTVNLTAGTTQTVTNIVSGGMKGNRATIKSDTAGTPATISKSTGTIEASHLTVQDITATGGATWNFRKSKNVSGNTGINFLDRYWVGGTGNWNDTTHWSTVSGGTGGASIPASLDNVYFDVNSFTAANQIVTVNTSSFCLDIDWSGSLNTPTLAGTSILNIYGSLLFIPQMTLTFSGNLIFQSTTTGKSITTAGKNINSSCFFYGIGGGWTLQDDLTLNGTGIQHRNGILNTNGKSVVTSFFAGNFTTTRTLILGTSIITCSGDWDLSTTTGLTSSPDTSTIILTGSNKNFKGGGLTYNNVTFSGTPITVTGSNTFNTLTLTAGKTVNFTAGTTQTVTNLIANGTSGNLITIKSTTAGSPATISKTSGTTRILNCSLKDITAIGGASFSAVNSTNVSGNSGWSFTNETFIGQLAPATTTTTGLLSYTDKQQIDKIDGIVKTVSTQTAQLKHGLNVITADQAAPLSVTVNGRTLVNLLGNDGNCEDISKWNAYNSASLALDSTNNKYGSNAIKFTIATGQNYGGISKTVSLKAGKYYILLTEVKNINLSGTIVVTLNSGSQFTPTTNYQIMWKKYSPSIDINSTIFVYGLSSSEGQSAYVDGIRLFEIDQATYNKIDVDPEYTGEKLAEKFPYVDNVKHLVNPMITKNGKNLLPPFTEGWTVDSRATIDDPYKMTLKATASGQYTIINVPVVGGQTYTASIGEVTGDVSYFIKIWEYKNGTYVTGTAMDVKPNIPAIKTVKSDTTHIRFEFNSTTAGTFTFKNPQLELGTTVTAFEPQNNDYIYANNVTLASSMDGSVRDQLYYRDGAWRKLKRWQTDVMLDGSLLGLFGASGTGYKVITSFAFSAMTVGDLVYYLKKYDGKPIQNIVSDTSTSFTASDQTLQISSDKSLRITVSNTDSGWTDAINPNNNAVKALANGWKANGNNGTVYNSWVNILDGSVPLSNTEAYVAANKAPSWTGWAILSYQLAQSVEENVNVEGSISLHSGGNQIEIGEGIMVREKNVPQYNSTSKIYYINEKGVNPTVPDSPLNYRLDKFISVYRNGFIDNKWRVLESGTNTNGKYLLDISESNYDPTAEYTVTYLALDKYGLTTSAIDVTGEYSANMNTTVSTVVKDIADIKTKDSVQDWQLMVADAYADNLRYDLGLTSGLNTTDKSNVVAAINEVNAKSIDQSVLYPLTREVANLKARSDLKDRVDGASGLFYDLMDGMNSGSIGKIDLTKTTTNAALTAGNTVLTGKVSTITGSGFQTGQEVTIYDDVNFERVNVTRSETTSSTGTVTQTNVTVVANAFDTSGNGGRKLVRLSNGWLVAAAKESAARINIYISKDNGSTWTLRGYCTWGTFGDYALASYGTLIYFMATYGGIAAVSRVVDFAEGAQIFGADLDTAQTAVGGCSLAIAPDGTLHAAWASKNTGYANSFNIRYSKSTDGGVTWAAPTQITTHNTAGTDNRNPRIVVRSNNNPVIVYEYVQGTTTYTIACYYYNGTTWTGNQSFVYQVNTYAQANPCATVAPNGRIWVAWQGKDSTDTTTDNIRVSYSGDGGVTWNPMQKLTIGNNYVQQDPSITVDKDNNVYVVWGGFNSSISTTYSQIRKITHNGTSWSTITTLTNNTTNHAGLPSTLTNYNDFTDPLVIYKDFQANAVKFRGIWSTAVSTYNLETTALTKSYKSGAKIARTTAEYDTLNKQLKFSDGFASQATNAITSPTTVVASAYDTSGTNGRKFVKLSNGWFVVGVWESTGQNIRMYTSKDNGNTWNQFSIGVSSNITGFAIANVGNLVHVFVANNSVVVNYRYDPVANINPPFNQPDSGQTASGTCSIVAGVDGVLHAAWSSKNSSYPNSHNIRYSKSTDGGVTWAAPTQITSYNAAGSDYLNPSIIIRNNSPIIVYERVSSNKVIVSSVFNGSTWGAITDIYNGSSYAQVNPCAAVAPNGRIWVVWHGIDSIDTVPYNIKTSYSDDGGTTWSLAEKRTSGNTHHQVRATIAVNKDNVVYLLWSGMTASSPNYYNIRKMSFNGAWSAITDITNNTTNHNSHMQALMDNTLDFSEPPFIYQDNQSPSVKFRGIWVTTANTPVLAEDVRYNIAPAANVSNAVAWVDRETDAGLSLSAALSIHGATESYAAMTKTTATVDGTTSEDQFIGSGAANSKAALRVTMTRTSTSVDKKIKQITGAVGA